MALTILVLATLAAPAGHWEFRIRPKLKCLTFVSKIRWDSHKHLQMSQNPPTLPRSWTITELVSMFQSSTITAPTAAAAIAALAMTLIPITSQTQRQFRAMGLCLRHLYFLSDPYWQIPFSDLI